VKDFFGFGIFFIIYFYFVFFKPNLLGHPDNYIDANPLVTPAHIVPEWYFLPFYAILRSIPDKLAGVVAMFSAILILFVLPWLDSCKVKSANYRPLFRIFTYIFFINFIVLGYLGGEVAEEPYITFSQISTIWYFTHFLIILPLLSKFEKTKTLPNSISESQVK
jgi:ubiquinol-cytochrome c reductase cytochrome b subunit